jgi:TonB family protein
MFSRSIPAATCLLALVAALPACAPRSQHEAIVMAQKAYDKDRCKGVLVRVDQARRMSREPIDRESRRMETECSTRLESARIAERRVTALCKDFDWTKDGTAIAIIQNAADFPTDPAARGTDGYVRFALKIDDDGFVADARVVESVPRGVFDSPAKKAISKWRYCPRALLPPGTRYPETAEMRFKNPNR